MAHIGLTLTKLVRCFANSQLVKIWSWWTQVFPNLNPNPNPITNPQPNPNPYPNTKPQPNPNPSFTTWELAKPRTNYG